MAPFVSAERLFVPREQLKVPVVKASKEPCPMPTLLFPVSALFPAVKPRNTFAFASSNNRLVHPGERMGSALETKTWPDVAVGSDMPKLVKPQ